MIDYKSFAENVLSDLMNNGSISDILLKMKIFASKRNDKDLLQWVSKELDGYEDEKPPKYRILNCGCKVDVFVPFRGNARIDFPVEMIENKPVKDRLSSLAFHTPIAEIENLCRDADKDGTISMKVPVYAYQFMTSFINGEIQDAYQYTTTAAVSQILVAVKSVLIDFLLKLGEEENIDFGTFIKDNPKMSNTTIIAGIVNTGNGTVNAHGSTNVVGDNNTINAENKKQILEILSKIDEIVSGAQLCDEYQECKDDIKKELEKEVPEKNFVKRCFQAIPSFLTGVGASIVANQINPLISSAIALL